MSADRSQPEATSPSAAAGDATPVQRGEVTRILQQVSARDDAPTLAAAARQELLPLVYEQLRVIARKRMAGERAEHTLQPTALVHEAYLKLVDVERIEWSSRRHFYGAAAEAMRRILIDHARKRDSRKRGGGAKRIGGDIGDVERASRNDGSTPTPTPASLLDLAHAQDPTDVLALNEALGQLEAEDERAAEVVRLRFFAGLSVDETAEVMDISRRTVMREWTFARARLFELLGGEAAAE